MGVIGKLRTIEGGRLAFWCPGCKSGHFLPIGEGSGPRWTFDGNYAKPTFSPSVLVTWFEPSDSPDDFDDTTKNVHKVCHSFVRNGRIEYLTDSTHALAGQTVELPAWQQRTADKNDV